MAFGGLWENLFAGAPQTVFNSYANTANALNTLRTQQLQNAVRQVQANAAPQLMQQALQQGGYKTDILGNQAQYAPQISQATLQGLDLRNQGTAINNQYAPALKQLAVQKAQIDNAVASSTYKYLPQQQQAALQLKQAQLQFIQQKIQQLPQQVANQTQKTNWYTSPQYTLPKYAAMQHGAAKEAWLANNQAALNNLTVNTLNAANQAAQPAQASQMGIPVTQPQMPPAGAGIVPMGASVNAPSAPQVGSPIAPPGTMPNQQQSVNQQQLANQIGANKGSVSPYISKKLDNTIEMDKFLASPAINTLAQSASKYVGILGKGQAFIDQWKTTNPQDYENYLQFGNGFTSNVSNIIKNIENLSIQPTQRAEIIGNFKKSFDQWSSNPARALDQFNRGIAQLKDVAGATSIAAQPIYPGAREKALGLSPPSTDNLQRYLSSQGSNTVQMIGSDGKTYNVPADKVDDAMTNYQMTRK